MCLCARGWLWLWPSVWCARRLRALVGRFGSAAAALPKSDAAAAEAIEDAAAAAAETMRQKLRCGDCAGRLPRSPPAWPQDCSEQVNSRAAPATAATRRRRLLTAAAHIFRAQTQLFAPRAGPKLAAAAEKDSRGRTQVQRAAVAPLHEFKKTTSSERAPGNQTRRELGHTRLGDARPHCAAGRRAHFRVRRPAPRHVAAAAHALCGAHIGGDTEVGRLT